MQALNSNRLQNTVLALGSAAALALGMGLITAPAQAADDLPWDKVGQVARTIGAGDDRIEATALADALIKDIDPIELIDLRPLEQYQAGHINGARNIPVVALLQADAIAELPDYKKLVLYSQDSAAAAQAAAMLRMAGLNAHVLIGGYSGWQALMNQPTAATDDPSEQAKQQAIACYFEGDYIAAAGLAVKQPATAANAGYTPAVTPVEPEPEPAEDPLGLGLGLGLGEGLDLDSSDDDPASGGGLIIGEGC